MRLLRKLRTFYLIAAISSLLLVIEGCTGNDVIDEVIVDLLSDVATGWFGVEGDNAENLDELEDDIDLDDDEVLASSVDLTAKLPPIGDQGKYGTCVTWSVGYNLKSFLTGVEKNYSKSQLAEAQNQYSPKDLFWAIDAADKGADCDGTSFEAALDKMISRGIAPLSEVPYTDLGTCSSTPPSSWTSVANNHKIANYRKIDYTDVSKIKAYLNDGRAISFGAKLGDNFMNGSSDEVLSSETYAYSGQHAYHAMVLSGYDDSKSAFRVVNTWGPYWGDNGYIWIDYNFFVDEFCFCAFVATNSYSASYNPDSDGDGVVDTDEKISGDYDLVTWELEDFKDMEDGYADDITARYINYNVYNVGDKTISKTNDWNILYVYYNAYNANDYGVIIFDYYSDDYRTPTLEDCYDDGSGNNICPDNYGDLENQVGVPAEHKPGSSANYWNYLDILAGHSVSYDAATGEDGGFTFYYNVPNITGKYYFVLIADGYDEIEEYDESNNYMYFTAANGEPLEISNGEITSTISTKSLKSLSYPTKGAKSPKPTVRSEQNVNAYSPQEIALLINHQKKTGALAMKMKSFDSDKSKSKGKVFRK